MNLCEPVPRYYSLRPLDEDKGEEHYPPPFPSQATPCMCSSASPLSFLLSTSQLTLIPVPVYNLLQLCAAVGSSSSPTSNLTAEANPHEPQCQQSSPSATTDWDDYAVNCDAVFVPGFPLPVPDDCLVPDWAWMDNSRGATNIALASVTVCTQGSHDELTLDPPILASTKSSQTRPFIRNLPPPRQRRRSLSSPRPLNPRHPQLGLILARQSRAPSRWWRRRLGRESSLRAVSLV